MSKDVNGVTTGISRTQTTIKYLGHIFGGLRDVEMDSLPLDCLKISTSSGRKHYLIEGDTTKLTKEGPESVRWVTSIEGHRAIEVAQRIARFIYSEVCGEDFEKKLAKERLFLFIPSSYLTISSGRAPKGKLPTFGSHRGGRKRIESFLPKITEQDLAELERIDTQRAWREEPKFRVGRAWPLSSHQLRRTLALYAQRSGLVTLPSLRRQLKHISEAMSLYYAKGSEFATDFIGKYTSHFGNEWRKAVHVSAALSYDINVVGTAKPRFGGHAHWMQVRSGDENGVISTDRAATLKKFKNGELAYRETALGGCTSVTHCDHAALEIFSRECIKGCANLVGDLEKLKKLIDAQTKFVSRLMPGTNEHTMEARDLASLEQALLEVEN